MCIDTPNFLSRFSFRVSRRIKTLTNGPLKGGVRLYVFLRRGGEISRMKTAAAERGRTLWRNAEDAERGPQSLDLIHLGLTLMPASLLESS